MSNSTIVTNSRFAAHRASITQDSLIPRGKQLDFTSKRSPSVISKDKESTPLNELSDALYPSLYREKKQFDKAVPSRVLDWPDPKNSPTSCLLDWSAKNVIVMSNAAEEHFSYNASTCEIYNLDLEIDPSNDSLKVSALKWNPSGDIFATGYNNGSVAFHKGDCESVTHHHRTRIRKISAISWKNENECAASGKTGLVYFFDIRSKRICSVLNPHLSGSINALAYNNDKNKLAISTTHGEIAVTVPKFSDKLLAKHSPKAGLPIRALAWVPDLASYIATATYDTDSYDTDNPHEPDRSLKHRLSIWDNGDLKQPIAETALNISTSALCFLPSTPYFISGHPGNSSQNGLIVWKISKLGSKIEKITEMRGPPSNTHIYNDTQEIALGPTGKQICTLSPEQERILFTEISPPTKKKIKEITLSKKKTTFNRNIIR